MCLTAAHDTADQLCQQGRLEEAAARFPQVIEGFEALQGPTGIITLTAKVNYATRPYSALTVRVR